jgi:hypothetical protein
MVRYYPEKSIYKNIKYYKENINKINKYLVDSQKKLLIFSKKEIYEWQNNLGLIKIMFEDKNIENINLNKYNLLCDYSNINPINSVSYQLPIDYILKEYKLNKYKLKNNAQIEMYLQFEENGELDDVWFESKDNIGEHGLIDIVTLLDELN